ncbi:MAG: MFS transporter [Paraprevotella sp.]|nr:MFS transporter [Paraprevotella sp.]
MNLKTRLAIMNFLEFAVWGAYLTCMSNYLGSAGLGDLIPWFYSIQGLVSLFMPTLIGILADRLIQPQRMLGICHFLAGLFMIGCWYMGWQTGLGNEIENRSLFVTLYTLSVAFYMPTIALSNTVAFSSLNHGGYDTIKDFPPIRVLGTVGFIVLMWFVNCAGYSSEEGFFFGMTGSNRFQYTYMQFLVSGLLSLVLALYTLTLPPCPIQKDGKKKSLIESFGLNAFKLFGQKRMALFFIFSMLLGMSLQVTNGYATPFITSFSGIAEYADSFGARNATLLTSLSQISEALCILMIPFFLKRFGIKIVMLMSMIAWVLRFGLFGLGNPGDGLWMFILSMIVYGVAFDFFNVSGALFVEQETDKSIQASAQGLFMLMTNGIGASVGTLAAGAVVNHYCSWQEGYLIGDWRTTWLLFASFSLVVAILFVILFRVKKEAK